MTRPSWGEYFHGLAQAASERGECTRRKVGAVLIDRDNRVRGVGYNGALPGYPSCLDGACPRGRHTYDELPADGDYSACIARHAEENLLANTRPQDAVGGLVYVSYAPCLRCQTLLRSAGVAMVFYPDGVMEL